MKKLSITAETITKALSDKHSGDIFIAECKTGSVHSSRLDAWVMRKSWAHPLTIGYEIKVSRQDFLRDAKWVDYLPYCNELSFVSPPHLIEPNEVSDDVGLYWTTSSGTKVYQKKKAKYRDVQIPDSLWRYILMWRARIGIEIDPNTLTKQDGWRQWLENRKIDRNFGYIVGRAIKEEIRKKITEVANENERLRNLVAKYEDIKQLLVKMGFDAERFPEWDVQRQISIGTIDTREASRVVDTIERDVNFLKSFISGLKNSPVG